MNGETRRVLRDDAITLVVALGALLGFAVSAHCEPAHVLRAPTAEQWRTLSDGEPMACLSFGEWADVLDSLELLPLVEAERDAAVAALQAERDVTAKLRRMLAEKDAEIASLRLELRDERAEGFRLERRSRGRRAWLAWGFGIGIAAGVAATR